MSIESIAIALHHSQATGATKLVLLGIANHDGDGGAWPSVATLAKYARVTPRHVIRCVRQLEDLGEIQTVISGGGLRLDNDYCRPNLYRFTLRCPAGCDGTSQHRQRPPLTPRSGGDIQVISPPDAGVTTSLTPTSPKPSSEPSVNQPAAEGGGKKMAHARETREGLSCAIVFGFDWPAAWARYINEGRAVGILFSHGVVEADPANRILAEWSALGDLNQFARFDGDAAFALGWACKASREGTLNHTADGDNNMPAWS